MALAVGLIAVLLPGGDAAGEEGAEFCGGMPDHVGGQFRREVAQASANSTTKSPSSSPRAWAPRKIRRTAFGSPAVRGLYEGTDTVLPVNGFVCSTGGPAAPNG